MRAKLFLVPTLAIIWACLAIQGFASQTTPGPVKSITSRSVMLKVLDPGVFIDQGHLKEDPAATFPNALLQMNRGTVKLAGQLAIHAHYHAFKPGQTIGAKALMDWYAKSTLIGSKDGKPTQERLATKRFISRFFSSYLINGSPVYVEVWIGPRGAWVFLSGTPDAIHPEPSTEAEFRQAIATVQPLGALDDSNEPAPIPDIPAGKIEETIVGDQILFKGPPITLRSLIDAFGGLSLPLEGYHSVYHQYADLPGMIYLPLVIETFGTGPLQLDPLLKFVARDRGLSFFGTPKQSILTSGGQTGVRYEFPTKNGAGKWTTEITVFTKGLVSFTNLVSYRSDSPEWTRLAKEILDSTIPSPLGLQLADSSAAKPIGEFAVKAIGVQSPGTGVLQIPNGYKQDVAKIRGLESGTPGLKLYGIEYELKDATIEFDLATIASDFEYRIQTKYSIETAQGDAIEYLWGPKDPTGAPTYGQRQERLYAWTTPEGATKQGCYTVFAYKSGKRVGVLIAVATDATQGLKTIRKWIRSVRWILPEKATTKPKAS